MMRIGLTGGIGSGKSSVASLLLDRGAILIDADRIAKEVLAPGGAGVRAVAARFGPTMVSADGVLDRQALAAVVFADVAARADLEAITHPLIAAEAARRFAAAPPDAIVVHDMPLLVEKRLSAHYHLVVVVLVDAQTRLRRLVEHRGMGGADARARIEAQADDAQRRAAADVVVDNSGTRAALSSMTTVLWERRIEPFAANLRHRIPAPPTRISADAVLVAQHAQRLTDRIARACSSPTRHKARLVHLERHHDSLALGVELPRAPDRAAHERLAQAGLIAVEPGPVLHSADPAWPGRVTVHWSGSPPSGEGQD